MTRNAFHTFLEISRIVWNKKFIHLVPINLHCYLYNCHSITRCLIFYIQIHTKCKRVRNKIHIFEIYACIYLSYYFFSRTMKKSKSKRRDRSRSRSNDSKSKRQKPRPKSPSEKDKTKTKTAPRKTRWQADDGKNATKKVSCHEIEWLFVRLRTCSVYIHI